MRFSARSHWSIRSAIGVLLFLITGVVSYGADRSYEEGLIARVEATFGAETRTAAGTAPEAGGVIKCATPLVYEIKMNWPVLSESTRQKIAGLMAAGRPVLDEYYDTPDGHFRIHFTRTGIDSVNMSFGVGSANVPNYVLRCASLMDTVVQTEVTTRGYRFPVSDQEGRPQEDPRFDIYMINLGSKFYGVTYPDTLVFKPNLNIYWLTSWMEISSDYTQLFGYRDRPFDAMAVTLAHEFFHSIQWTYDAEEAELRNNAYYSWFNEVSSTWMEDVVFDRVNDFYSYLVNFFHYPWISLRVIGNSQDPYPDQFHPYAACVWAMFLSERYDIDVMRDVWERCGVIRGFNTFDAFDRALQQRGASFASAWAEFLVWNYFTGSRWRSWSYQEGADFARPPAFNGQIPDALLKRHSDYPVSDSTSRSRPPYNTDELGGTYISFIPPLPGDSAVDFHFQLTPNSFEQWMVVAAGISPVEKPAISYSTDIFNPSTIQDWTRYDEVLVVISPFKSNPAQDALDRNLGFHYAVRDSFDVVSKDSIRIYSNPVFPVAGGDSARFRVDVIPSQNERVQMWIYTTDGRLVSEIPSTSVGLVRRCDWNCEGRGFASGIYLALVKIGDRRKIIKVAVRNDQ